MIHALWILYAGESQLGRAFHPIYFKQCSNHLSYSLLPWLCICYICVQHTLNSLYFIMLIFRTFLTCSWPVQVVVFMPTPFVNLEMTGQPKALLLIIVHYASTVCHILSNLTILLFYVSYLYNAQPSVYCVCHISLLSNMWYIWLPTPPARPGL